MIYCLISLFTLLKNLFQHNCCRKAILNWQIDSIFYVCTYKNIKDFAV